MSASDKIILEDWAITALGTVSALSGIQIDHIDAPGQANQERIIVGAVVEERELEGAQLYPAEIEIELSTTDRDAAAGDAIFAAIESLFNSFPTGASLTFIQANYEMLYFFEEEMSSADSRGPNTRHRSRKYPFKFLPIVGMPFFTPSGDLMFQPSGDLIFA